ncbi:hypothetical protein NKG94_31735 [Micromonospora sp. M12]
MPSYGFLSTHPPTRCGLATFNAALAAQLTADGTPGGIVRVTGQGDDQRPVPGWCTPGRRVTRPAGGRRRPP